jgi:hypothetical protein
MGGKVEKLFWIENIFMLLAIALLWPRIFLGWSGPAWFGVECLVLAVLVAIFIRRLGRLRDLWRNDVK